MKKTINIIAVLFLIIAGSLQAEAHTCVTIPFNYHTNDPYPNGPQIICQMEITYCYECSFSGMDFDIYISSIYNPDQCFMNADFEAQATNAMLVSCMNQPGSCLYPCSEGSGIRTTTVDYFHCWQHVHIWNEEKERWEWHSVPCDMDGACVSVYNICIKYGPDGAYLDMVLQGKYSWGSTNCYLLEEINDYPDPEPTGYWAGECFMRKGDCE